LASCLIYDGILINKRSVVGIHNPRGTRASLCCSGRDTAHLFRQGYKGDTQLASVPIPKMTAGLLEWINVTSLHRGR